MNDKIESLVKFRPAMYLQRYLFAVQLIGTDQWSPQVRKIIDFGCGDLSLFRYFRNSAHLTDVVFVDCDRDLLHDKCARIEPLMCDYLKKRPDGLRVRVLVGSLCDFSRRYFRDTDAVILLEVIEHLEADVLRQMPVNIFGRIQPKLVIVSTPNAEYNRFFENFAGMRHPDHKFEWTRAEFRDWAERQVLAVYPNYDVEFVDLGFLDGIDPERQFGGSTQLAVFKRTGDRNGADDDDDEGNDRFESIHFVDYPK